MVKDSEADKKLLSIELEWELNEKMIGHSEKEVQPAEATPEKSLPYIRRLGKYHLDHCPGNCDEKHSWEDRKDENRLSYKFCPRCGISWYNKKNGYNELRIEHLKPYIENPLPKNSSNANVHRDFL